VGPDPDPPTHPVPIPIQRTRPAGSLGVRLSVSHDSHIYNRAPQFMLEDPPALGRPTSPVLVNRRRHSITRPDVRPQSHGTMARTARPPSEQKGTAQIAAKICSKDGSPEFGLWPRRQSVIAL